MKHDTMPGERVSLHPYSDGVLVEVVVDEGGGDVRTVSAEFDLVDPETGALALRGELPSPYEESIRRHIDESEYVLRDARRTASP